jgi:hypothetical protein
MNQKLSKEEKIALVIKNIELLKNFPVKNGKTYDLYKSEYSYVDKLNDITMKYIKDDKNHKGSLYFEELDKFVDYNFSIYKNIDSYIKIRNNTYKK